MFSPRIGLVTAVVLTSAALPAWAKRVICIDGCNTPFVNNHEGYVRAQGLGPNDVIMVGGSLTDCLMKVANGDKLTIIAHGSGTGTGFMWGGMTYTGFGNGAGRMPVPAGFNNLMNVMVDFCSCWSARDPDGAGMPDIPLTEKIVNAMGGGGGTGNMAGGFNDIAWCEVCYRVACGTAAQRAAAIACLTNDPSWMMNPPANRPGTGGAGQPGNQQTAAQAIVDACAGVGGAGVVKVTIPNQIGVAGMKAGYKAPVNQVMDPPAGTGGSGCSCTSGMGCAWGTQSGIDFGQSINPGDLEPNSLKTEATPASCMMHGNTIVGQTIGSSLIPGDPTPTSADTFRIGICPLPTAVYRHRLTLTSPGPAGHVGSIRGLSVAAGPVINAASDVAVQTTSLTTSPPNFNQWYGFGRAEEIFYRVTGTPTTTAPYMATLATSMVSPQPIPGAFVAGPITITTEGQGHATDTEIHVLDSNLLPIYGYKNDDTPLSLPNPANNESTLQRVFAPGIYIVMVSRFNAADNQLSGTDDNFQTGSVLDFSDASVCSNSATGANVSFSVIDTVGAVPVPANVGPYEIAFFVMQVIPPSTPFNGYCFGDGTGMPCPCGNFGALGNGCANSVDPAGGHLGAMGLASVSADSVVLMGTGMPNSSALYFQGTATVNNVFGDGLRCAGGSVVRLGTKVNMGGASQYPRGGDLSVSVKGLVPPAGGLRTYQVWYRNAAAFCTPSTFNLTNGLSTNWIP